MLALNKADIEDIANGNHNRYVESQDKDELLRAVADKYLEATEMVDTITFDKIENIRQLLPDDDKYDKIRKLLGDIEDDLQSITE